jgi:Raf kinase inhibitor-like YbhB/YbcL family protein
MQQSEPATLEVRSNTFTDGATLPESTVFNGFGCTGGNRSPDLRWSGAPNGTKSYALILHDPDAPTGVGFFHWIMWNIPGDVTELPENAGDPASGLGPRGAVYGHTDFGKPGYGGPCPPPGHGQHRYQFTVYALSVPTLDLPQTATAATLRFTMIGKILAQGTLTGLYGR